MRNNYGTANSQTRDKVETLVFYIDAAGFDPGTLVIATQ